MGFLSFVQNSKIKNEKNYVLWMEKRKLRININIKERIDMGRKRIEIEAEIEMAEEMEVEMKAIRVGERWDSRLL